MPACLPTSQAAPPASSRPAAPAATILSHGLRWRCSAAEGQARRRGGRLPRAQRRRRRRWWRRRIEGERLASLSLCFAAWLYLSRIVAEGTPTKVSYRVRAPFRRFSCASGRLDDSSAGELKQRALQACAGKPECVRSSINQCSGPPPPLSMPAGRPALQSDLGNASMQSNKAQ